jgi:hypothetical protein
MKDYRPRYRWRYAPEYRRPGTKHWHSFDREPRELHWTLRSARDLVSAWRENYPKYEYRIAVWLLVSSGYTK